MRKSLPRRVLSGCTPVALLAALACREAAAPADACPRPRSPAQASTLCFATAPSVLGLRPGDTASVVLTAAPAGAAVTWLDGDTAVARIAGRSADGRRVVVRGVGAGATQLGYRMARDGAAVTGGVPVLVTAGGPAGG